MNIKLLVCLSIFIAVLCHIIFFNVFTFVFPIEAASPKPKFFFLGPILTKKDVSQSSPKTKARDIHLKLPDLNSPENGLPKNQPFNENDAFNPFAIRSINKPLTPQTDESKNKTVIKSTFEIQPVDGGANEDEIQKDPELELKLIPYQRLQFRSP